MKLNHYINITPFNDLGYGVYGVSFGKLLELYEPTNVSNLNLFAPDKCTSSISEPYYPGFFPGKNERVIYHWHLDDTVVKHNDQHFRKNNYIHITHFETTKLKESELDYLKKYKPIVGVASKWAVYVLINNGYPSDKIIQTPSVSPYDITNPTVSSLLYKLEDLFKYIGVQYSLKIFSSGKWEVRKSHPELIKAVTDTKLPITVFSCWNNPFTGGMKQPFAYLTENKWKLKNCFSLDDHLVYQFVNEFNANILCLPRIEKHSDIYNLYCAADVYYACSKGEGWDLPAVEAISQNCPVILSSNTAHLEYDNIYDFQKPIFKETSIIPCKEALAIDNVFFHGNVGNWYEPDYGKIVEALIFWHNHKQSFLNFDYTDRHIYKKKMLEDVGKFKIKLEQCH